MRDLVSPIIGQLGSSLEYLSSVDSPRLTGQEAEAGSEFSKSMRKWIYQNCKGLVLLSEFPCKMDLEEYLIQSSWGFFFW